MCVSGQRGVCNLAEMLAVVTDINSDEDDQSQTEGRQQGEDEKFADTLHSIALHCTANIWVSRYHKYSLKC